MGRACAVAARSPRRLRPHGVDGRARPPQRSREVGELAEERPGVARIDELLDPEGLGGPERRAQLREAVPDLRELFLRIGGGGELRAGRPPHPPPPRGPGPPPPPPPHTRGGAAPPPGGGARGPP